MAGGKTGAECIQAGLAALGAGDPNLALEAFDRARALTPEDMDATSLAGVALSVLGRHAEAEPLLDAAVAAAPTATAYRINRIDHLLRAGRPAEARAESEAILQHEPANALAGERLGDVAAEIGAYAEAVTHYERALPAAQQPGFLALKLARAYAQGRQFERAERALQYAERAMPGHGEVAAAKVDCAVAAADWRRAQGICREWLAKHPDDAMMWRRLSHAYDRAGAYEDAVTAFERALSIGPRTLDALKFFASVLMRTPQFERADAILAEAEMRAPNDPEVTAAIARLRTYEGRRDEAEEYCRKCIEADPTYIHVYPPLSQLRGGRLTEAEVVTVRAIAEDQKARVGARATARHVLGHHFDAVGDTRTAFDEYTLANRLASARNTAEGEVFNADGADAWTARIVELFEKRPAPGEQYEGSPRPIFIVGLPRSGSTLVESVLAAHPRIHAAGEAPMMPRLFADWMNARRRTGTVEASPEEIMAMRAAYFACVPVGADHVTDKNLLNIDAVGLIAQAFPGAPVFYLRKRPLEAVIGVYRQDLPKFWSYATSIQAIARRYVQAARIAAHWERIFPDTFRAIQYEDFVGDFEPSARSLVAACGLDWDDACLDFTRARKVAPTLSAMQVREQVAPPSRSRADEYAPFLESALAIFEEAGVDLATGAVLKP